MNSKHYKSETKGGGCQTFFPAHKLEQMIQFEEHMFEMVHLVGESSNMEIRKTYMFPKKSRVEIHTSEIV